MSKRKIKRTTKSTNKPSNTDIGCGKELGDNAQQLNVEELTEPSLVWRDPQPSDMETALYNICQSEFTSQQKAKAKAERAKAKAKAKAEKKPWWITQQITALKTGWTLAKQEQEQTQEG